MVQKISSQRYSSERTVFPIIGTTLLLGVYFVVLVFHISMSYIPGISVKNLILYSMILYCLRMRAGKGSLAIGSGLIPPFFILIFFALFSLIYTSLYGPYNHYSLLNEFIFLKSNLVDSLLLFWLFSSVFRSESDLYKVLIILVSFVGFTNVLTVMDHSNIVNLGIIRTAAGHDAITRGTVGEPNQYALYIVMFLPFLISLCVYFRGIARFIFIVFTLFSLVALIMSASRGGVLGAIVSLFSLMVLWRRKLSVIGIITIITSFSLLMLSIYLVLPGDMKNALRWKFDPEYRSEVSGEGSYTSGRLDIWKTGGEEFLESPFVGTGWNTFNYFMIKKHGIQMPAHNTYLHYFVTLGMLGGGLFTYLMFKIRLVLKKKNKLSLNGLNKIVILSYIAGYYGLLVGIFFVDLFSPWNFFWIYTGLVIGLVLMIPDQKQAERIVTP